MSFLSAINFTEERAEFLEPGIIRFNYTLTERGRRCIEKVENNLDEETFEIIKKLKKSIEELSAQDTATLIAKAKSLMKK